MRHRITIPALVLTLALAACSGGPGPTSPPATDGGGGGGTKATEPANAEPTENTGGGGGGGGSKPAGWDQYGKVHYEIAGTVQKSGDLGFIPAGSIFGGAQGSSLSFTIDGSNEVLSILVGADGAVVVSYGAADFSAPAAECTTSNWNIGATSGSGSFDCTAAFAIMASGAMVQGVTLKGTFDAHI